jgi:hypothetical protein
MTEQIPYLRQLWEGEPATFSGEFDQIDRAALVPVPPRPIPIFSGGSSDAAYRRAARLADGFIFGYALRDDVVEEWEHLQEMLREEGRPPDDFRAMFNLLPHESGWTIGRIVGALPRLRDAGATDVTFVTARQGFLSVDQHIDYLAELKKLADDELR